jgi:hypothetical protein
LREIPAQSERRRFDSSDEGGNVERRVGIWTGVDVDGIVRRSIEVLVAEIGAKGAEAARELGVEGAGVGQLNAGLSDV